MNKIVFVGLVALALTAAFVSGEATDGDFAGEYGSLASSNSSNSFTEESSSSSSLSPGPIPSSVFPSDSSSVSCQDGSYYSEKEKRCVPCAGPLKCATCSNGNSCDSCDNDRTLEGGACVVKCSVRYGDGCGKCTERRCTECTKEACCRNMEWFFNKTASTCIDPALVFGQGCIATDGNVCTNCTAKTCCGTKQYFNYLSNTCVDCSAKFGDKCSKCTYGTCSDCGDSVISSTGVCKTCANLFGEGCSDCNTTACKTAKAGFFLLGTQALSCSSTFGGKCTSCDENGCKTCSDSYKAINGYCKKCSDVFGENCDSCDSDKCLECKASSSTVILNGVSVPCDHAFGKGCGGCNITHRCSAKKPQYFFSYHYALSCEVIPDATYKQDCMSSQNRRRRSSYLNYAREDEEGKVDAEYKDYNFKVTCDAFDANCDECTKFGCTRCNDEYVLFGGACEKCSEIHGAHCSDCSVKTCSKCETGYSIGADGKCVKCEGETPFFDETTRTCLSCTDLVPNCKECSSSSACKTCEDGFYLGDDNKCYACSDAHGAGCTKCTKTECTVCTSDECCDGKKIIVKDGKGKCGTCADFDDKCSECSEVGCTECKAPSILSKGQCVACIDIFDLCGQCDADHCEACTDPKYTLTDNGCFEPIDEPSSNPSSQRPSSAAIKGSSKPDEGGIGGGAVAGIVIGVILVVALVAVGVYCFVTAGRKHGKIDPVIYEEDPEFISMSVL